MFPFPTTLRRTGTAALGVLVAAATLVPAGYAAAVELPGPDPVGPIDQFFLDTTAKPVLDWSVPPRWNTSWVLAHTSTYNDFVNPAGWPIDLNGCASTSTYAISRYTFTVAQVGTTWRRTYAGTSCKRSIGAELPALGQYRLSLTVHTDFDKRVSLPVDRIAILRDQLIVSMGDSLASGEGNPDGKGIYPANFLPDSLTPNSVSTVREAVWKDKRCHRSARSGPSLAARAFEDADPKTSVTFVSVACSGAELEHLINKPYGGIVPSGGVMLPAQTDAVAGLIGPNGTRPARRIDALLVSAGINDLDFSSIIEECFWNINTRLDHEDCVTNPTGEEPQTGIATKMAGLNAKFDALDAAITIKLPNTREIYLNNYPGTVFRGGGDGILGGVVHGIDTAEGNEIQTWGNIFSTKLANITRKFRGDAHRWNLVGDLAGPFDAHRYISADTWFTSFEESWYGQGDKNGTAHPNSAGHVAYGKILKEAMAPDQSSQYYRRVTVTIESVKAAVVPGSPMMNLDTQLWEGQLGWFPPIVRYQQVPRNGQWTTVPATLATYTIDAYVEPSSPRHTVGLYMSLGKILPIKHTRADGYGAGWHETVHPQGTLAVRYRVTTAAPPTGPVIGP